MISQRREILPETSVSHMRFWVEHFGYYWINQVPNLNELYMGLEINSHL